MASCSSSSFKDANEGEQDEYDGNGARIMSLRTIQRICKERGLFSTPACNNTLYLNSMKFATIQSLEEYTACTVLHLQHNCLASLHGLSSLANQLRVLDLSSNAITSLADLATFTALEALHVNNNPLTSLQGLPAGLQTLHVAKAGLSGAETLGSIAAQCPALSVLDINDNGFAGEACLTAMSQLASLKVLYVKRNPLAEVSQWRKRLVVAMESLSYLDDNPVEEIDRVAARAFLVGGREAEIAAKQAVADERRRQQRQNIVNFAHERARQRLRSYGGYAGLMSGGQGLSTPPEEGPARPLVDGAVRRVLGMAHTVPGKLLDSLASEHPGAEEAGECAVCGEELQRGQAVIRLPCSHPFHDNCVRPWLEQRSNSCPLCRTLVCSDQAATAAAAAALLTAGGSARRLPLEAAAGGSGADERHSVESDAALAAALQHSLTM